MSLSEHSPTPWVSEANFGTRWNIADAQGRPVAITSQTAGHLYGDKQRDANTEFIVRACNAHDALVEVLKDAAVSVMHQTTQGPDGVCLRTCRACRVDVALKLANGDSANVENAG